MFFGVCRSSVVRARTIVLTREVACAALPGQGAVYRDRPLLPAVEQQLQPTAIA